MSQVQAIDTSANLLRSLLWQHDNADSLKKLIELKQQWYSENHSQFWNNWFTDVFDISTANEFGLLVWARILNIQLFVELESKSEDVFGFGPDNENFSNGNFDIPNNGIQALSLEQKRLVVQMRYFQLTTRGAVTEINEFFAGLFPDGPVYVDDNLDMTADYFFTFSPSSQLQFIFENYDILPRPAGVGINILVQVKDSFGFETFHLNFENGNFGV